MSVSSTDPGNRNSGISQPQTIPENTSQTDQTETGNVRGNQFTPADKTAPAKSKIFGFKLPNFKSFNVFSKSTKSSSPAQPEFKEAVNKLKNLHPGMTEKGAVSVIRYRVQDRVSEGMTEQEALEDVNEELDGFAERRLEIETIRDKLSLNAGFRRIYTLLIERNETMLSPEARILAATAIHEKLNEVPADMPLDAILETVYQDVLTENDPAENPYENVDDIQASDHNLLPPPPEADDNQRPTPPDQLEGQGHFSWQMSNEKSELPVFKGFSRSEPNLGSEQFRLQPIPARSTLQSTSNEQDLDPNIGRPLPEMSLSGRDAPQRESEQLEAPDAPPTTMEGEFWDDPEVAAAVAESDAALAESFEKAENLDDLFEAFPPDTTGVKF